MPAKMRKLPGKRLYKVTDDKGHVHAKGTTKEKAEAQVRILNQARKPKVVKSHVRWM